MCDDKMTSRKVCDDDEDSTNGADVQEDDGTGMTAPMMADTLTTLMTICR